MKTLKTLVDNLNQLELVHSGPFPCQIHMGAGRVLILAGDNATGKSLIFRALAQQAHSENLSPITLSIRERSGGGTFEMASFRRSMIYGEEQEQSTGANSVGVIKRGFDNVVKRLGDGTRSVLMLDEPEMGLSEGYCRALGRYLAEQVRALPAEAPGLVVVSHSRHLVDSLIDGLNEEPFFIHTGTNELNLRQWLAAPEVRSVVELMNLIDLGHQGWRAFDQWIEKMNKCKTTKNKEPTVDQDDDPREEPVDRKNRKHRSTPRKRS